MSLALRVARRLPAPAAALLLAACATPPPAPSADGPPSLIVLTVVDQLTPELLDRYDGLFTRGLRRLRDEGLRFVNATHDHAITHTAAGHTTLGTGVYPARHGIVGNTWYVRDGAEWRAVYSMEDPEQAILGYPDLPGRGPGNIAREGLADWVLAHDPEARVVSISKKDRAAIGLAAHARGGVYWMADEGGEFITSEYYRSDYPEWIARFNREVLPRVYADTIWESRVPAGARALSRPDTAAYEFDGEHVAFPHRPSDRVDPSGPGALPHWRYEYTPFPDRAVAELAIEALRALELGRRGHVDYLAVSFSQTDLVGHYFGPGSREQLDNLLRLDVELGRLLDALDREVGRGRWVLALSADHGVLDAPEYLAASGVDAERLDRADRDALIRALQSADEPDARKRAVLSLPFVASAYTFEEIERAAPPDSFAVLFARSHSRERVGSLSARFGLYVRYRPYVLDWAAPTATHGTPYLYDRHVPLVFLGAGVRAGTADEAVATVDVAPTLARLAGIPAPPDLDGAPIARLRPSTTREGRP
ncbi:MAG TPA: alkaline phosphatase family protein [Longimicrobiales bacterium]|nr:alkaline phosphatase family protein [Longimicrobiales bacterium]